MEATTKQYADNRDNAIYAAAVNAAAANGNAAYQPLTPQLFAGIPSLNWGNGYVTIATDAQKLLWGTGAITINSGLYPIGAVISVLAWGRRCHGLHQCGGRPVLAVAQRAYERHP